MRRFVAVLLLFFVVAWVVAAAPPEEQATPEEAATVKPIPESAKKTKNPTRPTEESIENGRVLFSSQCAMCHGATGDGKGDLAARFEFSMPDFTDANESDTRADGEWFYVITHGHGRMRGEGNRLSDPIKWNMVNYIRSLSKK